jgi:hypothetical protein
MIVINDLPEKTKAKYDRACKVAKSIGVDRTNLKHAMADQFLSQPEAQIVAALKAWITKK